MCLPVAGRVFKVEKEWMHSGLLCAIVQGDENGHRCGYVRVPPGHSYHGKDYDTPNVDVHGGLTFAEIEPCTHEDGTGWWFGFDCAHAGDARYDPNNLPSSEAELRRKYPSFWQDRGDHYWLAEEVAAETERLAEQLAAII